MPVYMRIYDTTAVPPYVRSYVDDISYDTYMIIHVELMDYETAVINAVVYFVQRSTERGGCYSRRSNGSEMSS